MMRITETVKQLIIINIIFFVGTMIVGEPAFKTLSLYFIENPEFKFWQIITHMFMHADVGHIFFNMFGVFMFGTALEELWGPKKFLFFYISCGLGAALLHIGVNYFSWYQGMGILLDNGFIKSEIVQTLSQGKYDTRWGDYLTPAQQSNFIGAYISPSVGASGALYGIFAAYAFLFPNREMFMMFIPIPIKVKYFVGGIIAIDLYLGIKGQAIFGTSDGIAHFAHLGGALVGFLMMWYWKKNQFNNKRWN